MTVTFEQFLTKCALDTENPEKFLEYVPKLEAYRARLAEAVKPELSVSLPGPIETLRETQFDGVSFIEKALTAKELEITGLTAQQLIAKYASGELTVTEVFKCYAKRATIAHQLTNCALEIFTEEGFETAAALDEHFKKTGQLVGPLHGVPVSLKEHLTYKGKITHACYVALIDNVQEADGITVKLIREMGAVFYIRTSQPQSLMHGCSDNNFAGFSYTPQNLSLTSGGSSSGEGAIVGAGGSVIGIGSDIGGSVRVPAAFCGVFGLRPTTKRISMRGNTGSHRGQESVLAVSGPMSRNVDDINYFMESYAGTKPWNTDPDIIRMDWKTVPPPAPKDIKIAILHDDGIVRPTPPIVRGLKEISTKLKAAGVTVVDMDPIEFEKVNDTTLRLYSADGHKGCKANLSKSGEPVKKLTKWFLNLGSGETPMTIGENRDAVLERDNLRYTYTKFMNDNDIDFIISPVHYNVGAKPEKNVYFGYTVLQNILDFPALTFPTGLTVDQELDTWDELKTVEFRSPLEELCLADYLADQYKNAPICSQICGRRWHDEEVVAAGKLVSEILAN